LKIQIKIKGELTMKSKKFDLKSMLKKQTIASLNERGMADIKAGAISGSSDLSAVIVDGNCYCNTQIWYMCNGNFTYTCMSLDGRCYI
jgi:hypothetical protein